MSTCASCGRYIGLVDDCPYCGARQTGRVPVRVLRWVAVTLVVLGLGTLWLAARQTAVPLVALGEADAWMNTAYVRVRGRCVEIPTYDPTREVFGFWIDDGTGRAYVTAYRSETRELIAAQQVPALGDLVEVTGTLRVRPELLTLVLNAPDALRISRNVALDRSIGSLTVRDEYQRVRVRGQVRAVTMPHPSLTLITLRDATGVIPVVLSHDLITFAGISPTLRVGQTLEVTAAVATYRGRVQLVLASPTDLVPLDQPVHFALIKPVAALTPADVGRMVLLRGRVMAVSPFSAGVKAILDDGSGTVVLLLWRSLYDAVAGSEMLKVGAQVQAQGQLALYQGMFEIVPEIAEDVQILATAVPSPTPTSIRRPTPTAVQSPAFESLVVTPSVLTLSPTPLPATPSPKALPAAVSVGTITAARIGEELTVEGIVVGTASFSQGFRFTVDDGSGRLVLLMWHSVYDDCWDRPNLNLGAHVRATGKIVEYQGELQLQPAWGGQVQVLAKGTPLVPLRTIGSLGGADVGQRVMIEGQVLRVGGHPSSVEVALGDESGEIVIFVWRNILDRVPQNVGLGTVGSRVRVVGLVEVYRGNLQLKPALPYDITVLEIAQE